MKLIVGLGNPGDKYLFTRHNVGFMLIDVMASKYSVSNFRSEHKALTARVRELDSLIMKPQTYMNLSGQAVQPVMSYYNLSIEDLLVIHDDVDQPFGGVKFQKSRGAGGHNGIKSIHECLSSNDYARLKIGVGRPTGSQDTADHVLQSFNKDEMAKLPEILDYCLEGVEFFIQNGFDKTANHFNKRI